MIIKPNAGARIFAGMAGITLILLACMGIAAPFPGLLFTVLGFPLGIFALGFAFGAAQTRVSDEGISQRNFFFVSKKLAWKEMESSRVVFEEYKDQSDSTGWPAYRTRTLMEFRGSTVKIRINANGSGDANWWEKLRQITKEKLGDKFEG